MKPLTTTATALLLGAMTIVSQAGEKKSKPSKTIVETAVSAGTFKTLAAALGAADLIDTLNGKDPFNYSFTVFAPTDAAFAKLPKGTVEDLLKPENKEKLQSILSLHVVKGKVSAGDALNAGSANAVSGGGLEFGINDGIFQVNGTTIVKTDIECDNGVIHVIDAVLLPCEKTAAKSSCGASHKTAMSPTRRIEFAVKEGGPVFNHGDHGKCADIYSECMQTLAKDSSLDHSTREMLTQIVSKAKSTHCATSRAWMLRSGLDRAYKIVSR